MSTLLRHTQITLSYKRFALFYNTATLPISVHDLVFRLSLFVVNYFSSNRFLCPLARKMTSQANLPDEYGKLDCSGDTYVSKKFVLESGAELEEAHVRVFI